MNVQSNKSGAAPTKSGAAPVAPNPTRAADLKVEDGDINVVKVELL